jgi:hypothetical protein
MPMTQSSISSRSVQPTNATMAVMSRTDPDAWRESVRSIPSTGVPKARVLPRIADTSPFRRDQGESPSQDGGEHGVPPSHDLVRAVDVVVH